MFYGILNKGLHGQGRDLTVVQRRVDFHMIGQFVLIAQLHDGEIVQADLYFVLQRDFFVNIHDTAQIGGKSLDGADSALAFTTFDKQAYGI